MAREPYEAHGLALIESGLKQRRSHPQSFAHVIGSPRDAASLVKIFSRATAAHAKLVGMTDEIVAEMAIHGVATEAELAKYRTMLVRPS